MLAQKRFDVGHFRPVGIVGRWPVMPTAYPRWWEEDFPPTVYPWRMAAFRGGLVYIADVEYSYIITLRSGQEHGRPARLRTNVRDACSWALFCFFWGFSSTCRIRAVSPQPRHGI